MKSAWIHFSVAQLLRLWALMISVKKISVFVSIPPNYKMSWNLFKLLSKEWAFIFLGYFSTPASKWGWRLWISTHSLCYLIKITEAGWKVFSKAIFALGDYRFLKSRVLFIEIRLFGPVRILFSSSRKGLLIFANNCKRSFLFCKRIAQPQQRGQAPGKGRPSSAPSSPCSPQWLCLALPLYFPLLSFQLDSLHGWLY